ncbi:MAG: hypothetical protein GWO10_16710, partial [candidate division Zixibacteria bacterium]|nr:hypothetical protein [Phycisphaerae bacterium]NIR65365.1 hypothetical protein [candidate division Zixibacteria bacterium]NIW97522.1 hypothetical protein [Phycisphaerae bacterium]
MGLLGKEAPKIPVREVADLTPMEQLIQAQLEKLYGKTVEGGELATKHYADILKRDVDPTKSKEYKGFLTEAER